MRKLTIYGLVIVLICGLFLAAAIPGPEQIASANAGTNWNAAYFNGTLLQGSPVLSRVDNQINFNWGAGSPDASVPVDNFSARWTKTVNFPTTGTWTFKVGADDGVRMWIDVTPIVDKWRNGGYEVYQVSIDQLTAGTHELKVEYYESVGDARIDVQWWYGGASAQDVQWNAAYYNNIVLGEPPALTRVDNDINFDWGNGRPADGVSTDNFSVRWKATVDFPVPGRWRFKVGVDDGARVFIDVTEIMNEWHGSASGYTEYEVDVYSLTSGNHEVTVEYFEISGAARINVDWWLVEATGTGAGGGGTGDTTTPVEAVPTVRPPTVVMAGVTANNVNVRTGPGLGYPVVGRLDYPDDYFVVAGVPDLSWLLIRLENGSEVWVSNVWVYLYSTDEARNEDTTGGGQPDFVDDIPRIDMPVAPPSLPPEGPSRVTLTGQTTDTVRLRDGASLYGSRVIGSVPQGAGFTVEAHNGNGAWYLISYQGIRGWVSALYVRLLDGTVSDLVASSEVVPAPPLGQVFVPEEQPGVPAVTVRGRANSNLRMRDAASLYGDQIGSVPENAEFVIEGRNTNGAWYLITWEGQQGWVNSPYVTLIEGTVPDLPIR
ncbi:MAG: SH3 domain-containing protein [Anaerolineae bacterium]|nr:SH3 domain-containing protein [Anaerolineae bacterium]